MVLRALHLCAGYGGFDLALGDTARTVAYVERDAYAAATLVARMGEARLDQAPVWSDLCTFDAAAWRGRVDLVTAGFPCQPFSAAGKRMGTDDDRWLWPAITNIIRDVEPSHVFLENVPGVVRAGLAHVLGDLADLGFDAEWGLLAASAVGAPHRRERFWLVAQRPGVELDAGRDGLEQGSTRARPIARRSGVDVAESDSVARLGRADLTVGRPEGRDAAGRDGTHVGHASGARRSEVARGAHGDEGPHGPQHAHVAHGAGEDVADAAGVDEREPHHAGRPLARQDARPDIGGHRFPPRPDDTDGWHRWEGAQPSVRRGADGATEWLADALHLGGNGLVPQCAREAWRQLTARLADDAR